MLSEHGESSVIVGRNGSAAAPGAVVQNVAAVAALEGAMLGQRTAGERVADGIARIVGTPAFAVAHLTLFGLWILVNTRLVPGWPVRVFDPYPFSFLTFLVSLEAILLSIFVLINQNRLTRQADRRAHLDLQVNLLAEQESTRTLELLQRITEHLGISRTDDDCELATPTNVEEVVSTLDRTLPKE
jgi:uncharacterized membrane protein